MPYAGARPKKSALSLALGASPSEAEVTQSFGGLLASPLTFNLGVKLQWPIGRSLP